MAVQEDEGLGGKEERGDYEGGVGNNRDEAYERIYDTMYATILRRYQLEEIAELYERERAEHD